MLFVQNTRDSEQQSKRKLAAACTLLIAYNYYLFKHAKEGGVTYLP